ncbi:Nitroalkane oxidase, partial [Pseudocercospora fuligena]
MPIDFHLSANQLKLQQDARAFASQVLAGASAVYDQKSTQAERFQSLRPIYRTAVAAGLIKGQIPVPLGGTNESLVDASIVLEELYAADPSATVTLAGTGLGLTPLIMSGNEKLQKEFLKPFLEAEEEGEPLASLVHSEPGGTANWLEKGGKGLQTTATRDGEDWVVNGEKLWTTNSSGWDGRGADLQCLVCRQSPEPGAPQHPDAEPSESIIVLLVTRKTISSNPPSAYTILSEPELSGNPATSGPHTRYTNLRVPSSQVLAIGKPAADLIVSSLLASAALVGIFSVSIMRKAFDLALEFAKEDDRNGSVKLIERQSVADLLTSLKIRIDSSRLMAWKGLFALEQGGSEEKGMEGRKEACVEAKIFGSDNAMEKIFQLEEYSSTWAF